MRNINSKSIYIYIDVLCALLATSGWIRPGLLQASILRLTLAFNLRFGCYSVRPVRACGFPMVSHGFARILSEPQIASRAFLSSRAFCQVRVLLGPLEACRFHGFVTASQGFNNRDNIERHHCDS